MLLRDNTVLIVVDVQGKLAQLMADKQALFANLQRIIRGVQVLDIPILWVEQYPEGMGPTIAEIAPLLLGIEPISKLSFSCCGNGRFMRELTALSRKQVLIAGIETHVCVYQTARDLVHLGYEVEVVADAVSSRTIENREIGLDRIKTSGARLTSTEMALFELLRVAEGEQFKKILKIIMYWFSVKWNFATCH